MRFDWLVELSMITILYAVQFTEPFGICQAYNINEVEKIIENNRGKCSASA